MMGGFGKSKAKVYMEKQTGVTFKDVAGQDEAKESLQEIIDFLHNPQKYTAIGAKLPKGALLRLGRSTMIRRSKRPGRSSALSRISGRLVAARHTMPLEGSKPSISLNS